MNKGCFKKGSTPWNKDLKGIHLSPNSEFKKGQRVGEAVNTWRGGIQIMNKDCIHLNDGVGKRIRRPKKVLQDAGIKLIKGWVIYHIDKQKHNDEFNNLIQVPRAILIKLNKGLINSNYQNITQSIELYLKEK